jgi:hypothetical protein
MNLVVSSCILPLKAAPLLRFLLDFELQFYLRAINMAPNGAANGVTHKFDPNFTQLVINATGPKATPRIRKVMAGLIRHLHDFCREEEITVDEWMAAMNFVCSDSG